MNEIIQRHGLSIAFVIIVLLFVLYYSSDKDNLLRYIHPNELAKMDKNSTKDFLIGNRRG
jgi:hypothetical protein